MHGGAGIGGRLPVCVHCAASSGLAGVMGGLQQGCAGDARSPPPKASRRSRFPSRPVHCLRATSGVCANTRNLPVSSQWPCIGNRTDFVRVHSRQSASPARCAGLAHDIAPPPRAPPAQAPRAASRPPAGGACLRATRVRRPVRPREPAVGRALAVVVRRGVDPALAVAVVALVRRACGGGGCDLRGARPAAVLARRWSSRRSRSVQGATRSFSSGRSRICFSVSRRVSRTWPTDARARESARASCSSRGCARRTCAGQSKRRAGPRVLLECVHRAFHEPAARRAHRRRESPHRLSAQRRRLGCKRSAPCMRRGSCARISRPRPSSRWWGIPLLVPVSVGVAPSAWLAKCAAEANKPNAAVVWRRGDLPAVYAGLELEDLPGAGPRICVRLRAAGLTTVEAIHGASRSRIIAAWGSIEGERVRLALQGHDVPARVSRRCSVAHGRVLTGRDRCWRAARQIVRWLCVCALHRCAEGGQCPGRVRLEVVTAGGAVRGGVGRLGAFGHELDLLRAVSTLWDEAAAPGSNDPPARVGVVLEALCDASAPCLFEAHRRERCLQWMVDRVRDRYGARALLWGECGDPRGPYTGAKIACQSFPDWARLRWLGLVDAHPVFSPSRALHVPR